MISKEQENKTNQESWKPLIVNKLRTHVELKKRFTILETKCQHKKQLFDSHSSLFNLQRKELCYYVHIDRRAETVKERKKAVSMNGHNRLRMSCQKKRFMLTAGQTSNHDRSRLEQQILLVILPAFLSIVRCNKEKKNTSIENKSKYF